MTLDQGPLRDVTAEKLVLGAILLENAVYGKVAAILVASDFSRDEHVHIFKQMGRLHDRGEEICLATLKAALARAQVLDEAGGISYLASLTDGVVRAQAAEHYAEIVRGFAEART